MAPTCSFGPARHWPVLSLAAAIILPAPVAAEQVRPPAGKSYPLEFAGTGKVAAISDGRSFFLDDGKEI